MAQHNVDHNELDKFAKAAHRWWDKNSEFKALHDINPMRMGYIESKTTLKNARVIDVGCGGGILTESLCQAGANTTGIDLGEAALSVAKLHAKSSQLSIDYQLIAAEEMAEQHAAEFDVVTCLEMLEHVPDPTSIVRAVATLVKPGGDVFFSTLNRNLKSFLFAILGAEYILNLIPRGTHEYARFIKPSELEGWMRANQLQLQDITGLSYNPLSQQYSLGNDVGVNYLLHAKRVEK